MSGSFGKIDVISMANHKLARKGKIKISLVGRVNELNSAPRSDENFPIEEEIFIHSSLQHANIVPFIGYTEHNRL